MNSGLSRYQRSSPSRVANLLASRLQVPRLRACTLQAENIRTVTHLFLPQIFKCRFCSFLQCRAAKACSLNEENRRRDQSSTVSVKMNKIGKIYGTELWVEF